MIKADVLENGEVLIYEKTVSDSVRFETVRFNFPVSWKGLNKTAVFKNGDKVVSIILNTDSIYCVAENECFIPHEVIHAPKFTVSVFGVNKEKRATTARGEIFVLPSGYESGDYPLEPTESEYSQILTSANEALGLAQSVREDLDSGNYTGPKGEKGDTGEAGIYYGDNAPEDDSHPVWINPKGNAYDENELNTIIDGRIDAKIPNNGTVIAENADGITGADLINPFLKYSVIKAEAEKGGAALCSYRIKGNDIYLFGMGSDNYYIETLVYDVSLLQVWMKFSINDNGEMNLVADNSCISCIGGNILSVSTKEKIIKLTGIY